MKRRWIVLLILFIFLVNGCKENDNEEVIVPDNGDEEVQESLIDEVIGWLTFQFENIVIYQDFEYPTTYLDTGIEIELCSFDVELSDDGKYTPPIVGFDTEILFIIYENNVKYELFLPVKFKGTGTVFDAVNSEIDQLIPEVLTKSIILPTKFDKYNCEVVWKSLDESIITNEGIITKSIDEEQITFLNYTIISNGEAREYSKVITVEKMSNEERVKETAKYIRETFSNLGVVEGDVELERYNEKYGAYIRWESWNPSALTDEGKYIQPLNDEEVILEAMIICGLKSERFKTNLIVKGVNEEDMWKKIENFLERINVKEIKNQKYHLYGWEEGYEAVPTQNIGYLPFYDDNDMEIVVDLLPDDSPLKPNRLRTATKYVVIHNTGMAHPTATAQGLNEYIHTTDRVASWHFSIDDKETYQHLGIDEVGWHAGDGSTTYLETWSGGIGGGNQNGIGIESCVYAGVDFNQVMRRIAKLSAMLLIQYDLDINCVKQHYHFSGKDCPQVIRHSNRWEELLELIRLELFAQTELKGVTFKWTSLSPDIMDDSGKVINHPGVETEIMYKVEVNYNGEVREFTYKSTLLALEE